MRKAFLQKKFNSGFVKTVAPTEVEMTYDNTSGKYYLEGDEYETVEISDTNYFVNDGRVYDRLSCTVSYSDGVYKITANGSCWIDLYCDLPAGEYYFSTNADYISSIMLRTWASNVTGISTNPAYFKTTTAAYTIRLNLEGISGTVTLDLRDFRISPYSTITIHNEILADTISKQASGKEITIKDGENNKGVKVVKLYGECIQEGTPTPDNPIPITTVYGTQTILDAPKDNVFNKETEIGTVTNCTYTYENGVYTLKKTGAMFSAMSINLKVNLPVGTYYYEWNEHATSVNVSILNNSLTSISSLGTSTKKVFTITTEGVWIKFARSLLSTGSAISLDLNNLTLIPCNKGVSFSLADEYCSSPNGIADTIEKISGVWTMCRRIGKVTLDGSEDENWTYGTTNNSNWIAVWFSKSTLTNLTGDIVNTNNEYETFLSNQFPMGNPKVGYTNRTEIGITGYSVDSAFAIMIIPTSIANGSTQWKEFLSSNILTIYYQLATPVYTAITDTALLNFLDNMEIQDGINVISSSMLMDMKYNCVGVYKTLIDNEWYYITINNDLNSDGTLADRLWLDTVNKTVEIENKVDNKTTDSTLIKEETKVLSVYDKNLQISGDKVLYRTKKF